MRLRTLESYGLINNGILNSYPSLHGKNESCEIVVVGGGITGALVSYALVKKGYSVILIDKRDIACGSTAATTSLLQYEIDVPLHLLSDMIGEVAAADCYKAGIKAINDLDDLIKQHGFDCGFERKQSLFIARSEKDVAALKKEFIARDKHELGVTWLDRKQILDDYGIICYGAILSNEAAGLDAFKLAHLLIAHSAEKGMKIYDQTPITKFDRQGQTTRIWVDNEYHIDCNKIIYCTGYESTEMLKEKIADLFYTYASISERGVEVKSKLKNTLVWDTGSPYMYMRYTHDGRLLIGGEDSSVNQPFFQQFIKERKADKLIKTVKQVLSNVEFIEDFSWAGKFGSTKDGLPYIGSSPEYKDALFALGFGGNGIIFSVQAMGIITDQLAGKENKLSSAYRFGR